MILTTPPVGPVVPLPDLKAHLRVDHDDEDALITSLEMAAVAYLDGWGGILGRAIKAQSWTFTATAGDIVSPMPDVTAATQDGQAITVADDVLTVPADGAVTITCALPARYLPTVQMAVKLIVSHWFEDRAAGPIPASADALISSMRMVRV